MLVSILRGMTDVTVEEFTIDELAARTGTTVRTIRFYNESGLLPPAERRGRLAYYGAPHRIRLELVQQLQQHGYTLAAITKVLARLPEGATAHDLTVTTVDDTLDGDVTSIAALVADPGGDSAISLREAIAACNNTPNDGGPDSIRFSIPGTGPHVIVVTDSALPAVTDAVVIDGHSEPDFTSSPVIELDGTSDTLSEGTENGIYLRSGSDGSTVRGLAIHGFPESGILLEVTRLSCSAIDWNFGIIVLTFNFGIKCFL